MCVRVEWRPRLLHQFSATSCANANSAVCLETFLLSSSRMCCPLVCCCLTCLPSCSLDARPFFALRGRLDPVSLRRRHPRRKTGRVYLRGGVTRAIKRRIHMTENEVATPRLIACVTPSRKSRLAYCTCRATQLLQHRLCCFTSQTIYRQLH